MVKKVKCSQYKYLKNKRNIKYNSISYGGLIVSKKYGYRPTSKYAIQKIYGCEAGKSISISEDELSILRECDYFRYRTSTAWQEIRRDIFSKTLSITDWFINLIKK